MNKEMCVVKEKERALKRVYKGKKKTKDGQEEVDDLVLEAVEAAEAYNTWELYALSTKRMSERTKVPVRDKE